MSTKLFTSEELNIFYHAESDSSLRGSMLFLGFLSALPKTELREIFTEDIIERIRSWEK